MFHYYIPMTSPSVESTSGVDSTLKQRQVAIQSLVVIETHNDAAELLTHGVATGVYHVYTNGPKSDNVILQPNSSKIIDFLEALPGALTTGT